MDLKSFARLVEDKSEQGTTCVNHNPSMYDRVVSGQAATAATRSCRSSAGPWTHHHMVNEMAVTQTSVMQAFAAARGSSLQPSQCLL